MTRTVVDLATGATLLDAADRIAMAPPMDELALRLPAGSPIARSAVLLAVAHRLAGSRPFAIVTPDPRARAVAASAHVRAFKGSGARAREVPDATEREAAPAPTVVAVQASRPARAPLGRMLATTATFLAAAILAGAATVPSAAIVVSPSTSPVGPIEFSLRAGPGGEIEAQGFAENVSAKVTGTATGSKTVETKATGTAHFTNKTTDDIPLPRGTIVRAGNTRFLTTEAKSLPRSILIPFLLSSIDVAIEAENPGRVGNVGAGSVSSSDAARYDATNPQPTAGGDTKTVKIVTPLDYDNAARGIDAAVRAAADTQVARWRAQVKPGFAMAVTPVWSITSQLPASQFLGQEVATFDILVAARVSAFAVANDQPRAAAIARLRTAVEPGNDVDVTGAAVDIVGTPTVTDSGVSYRLRAAARQYPRYNVAALRAALAGRAPGDAEALLRERGLRLVEITRFPDWWPRLPILETRIRVVDQTQ